MFAAIPEELILKAAMIAAAQMPQSSSEAMPSEYSNLLRIIEPQNQFIPDC